GRTSQALCKAAAYAAKEIRTEKIAVFTESGLMARRLSNVRSGLQSFALTTSQDACNQLALIWGVTPHLHEDRGTTGEMLTVGEQTLLETGAVNVGETIIMMAGRLSGFGLSSSVIVWTVGAHLAER
ncbi:MAG TPA: pyruvate kinase alpha/beta domain-containing protein, partial [Pyrinomonadaceae bacterium]|nr:pyruvate kinase alpha/beta domain-containing protein [Pyrinomonadaceae bacterium]